MLISVAGTTRKKVLDTEKVSDFGFCCAKSHNAMRYQMSFDAYARIVENDKQGEGIAKCQRYYIIIL